MTPRPPIPKHLRRKTRPLGAQPYWCPECLKPFQGNAAKAHRDARLRGERCYVPVVRAYTSEEL